MPLLAGRRVLAPDTPGYGMSDAPPALPAFVDYAGALADALPALVGDGPVDLFGFHTGAMLALQMAVLEPARVRRLVLVGVPYFPDPQQHAAWRARLVHDTCLGESFDQFRARWDYFITGRTPGLPLARAFACFVDELLAYPREWWAHAALFATDPAACLAQVAQPVLVINPDSALAPASRAAAAVLPNARMLDCPALTSAIFDLGAQVLADAMLPFLDAVELPQPQDRTRQQTGFA
jgi:pimeloyl-ACP methyl ester carboxylesterase